MLNFLASRIRQGHPWSQFGLGGRSGIPLCPPVRLPTWRLILVDLGEDHKRQVSGIRPSGLFFLENPCSFQRRVKSAAFGANEVKQYTPIFNQFAAKVN